MNRQERRELEKKGIDKETIDKLNAYDKPCTILEVVKMARAIAEDVVTEALEDYRQRSTSTIIALTLQLELAKKMLFEKGIITEEEFMERYKEDAKAFEDKQREYFNALKEAEAQQLQDEEIASEPENPTKSNVVDFSSKVQPIEVTLEKEEEDN